MTIRYLTKEDMCAKLKIARATLDRYVQLGRVPQPFKLGARPMWVEDEVDLFILELRREEATTLPAE